MSYSCMRNEVDGVSDIQDGPQRQAVPSLIRKGEEQYGYNHAQASQVAEVQGMAAAHVPL